MNGVARTTWLLLCWGGLTRWLLGIGLTLAVVGLWFLRSPQSFNAQPLFAIAVFIGLGCAVISPLLVGGIIFRSLSSARAVNLIPNGRLKLLLGAFHSQLLLALLISLCMALLWTAPPLHQAAMARHSLAQVAALAFVISFLIASVQFIGYYWASQYRFGFAWPLGYLVWPRVLVALGKHWDLNDWLLSAPGLATQLGATLLLWVLFALLYLRSRRIDVPHAETFLLVSDSRGKSKSGVGNRTKSRVAPAMPTITRTIAMRTLLLGLPRYRRTMIYQILLWLCLLVLFVGLPMHFQGGILASQLQWMPLILVAGPIAGALSTIMTQRARTLWLLSGLGRTELFGLVERYSLRLMLMVTGGAIGLAVPQFILSARDAPAMTHFLLLTGVLLSCAIIFVYAGMAWVRGHRVAGFAIVAVSVALWLIDMGNVLNGTAASLPLLCAQLLCIPVLRLLARRQWRDLDWVLNRPKRMPTRLA